MNMVEAQGLLNTGYTKIFEDMSDGKVRHNIEAKGWFQLNRHEDDDGTNIPCTVLPDEVKQIASENNIDLLKYNNISIIANCSSYFTIGGRANLNPFDWLGIGKKQSYVKMAVKPELLKLESHPFVPGWANFVPILIHERGHNFGLLHSNALDCGSNQYLQGCEHIEYGNEFDKMGASDGAFVFNADQQRKAGWKSETKDFIHIKENGTFWIDRLTTEKNNRKIGAYIYPTGSDKKAFMVEYRQAHKYDNNLSSWIFRNVDKGIHLYSYMSSSSSDKSPYLGNYPRYIDSSPTELPYHQDTAYSSLVGEFFDPIYGIGITMDRVIGTKAQFSVYYDPDRQICFKTGLSDWTERPFITRYSLVTEKPAELEKVDVYMGGNPNPVPTPSPRPGYKMPSFKKRAIRSESKKLSKTNRGRNPSSTKVALGQLRNRKEFHGSHVVLIPGDKFSLNFISKIGDHLMCPRNNLLFKWLNSGPLVEWLAQERPSSGGSSVFEPDSNDDGDRGDKPWDGYDIKYNTFKRTKNYDGEYELQKLIVPESALGMDYKMQIETSDRDTGEKILNQITIHVRSRHDAVIPIELEPIKYK